MILATFQNDLRHLADAIENDWVKENYQDEVFPTICQSHLNLFNPANLPSSIHELLQEIHTISLPVQSYPKGGFSDFPLTLVNRDRFYIDIYFWFHSDTSIHNHHFSGAFKVIRGSSVELQYSFEPTNVLSLLLTEGKMKVKENLHLTTGKVETINRGRNFIHQVFHLEKPTVTLCVRTPPDDQQGLCTYIYPQFELRLPDPTPLVEKWFQNLRLNFKQGLPATEIIPFDEGEILKYIYVNDMTLKPENDLVEFLCRYIEKRDFAPNFIPLLKKRLMYCQKMKELYFSSLGIKE